MVDEEWVPLLGYPGYSISNLGRVRNDKRDRVLTIMKLQTNYVYVGLVKDGVQVNRSVAKMVSETFLPKPVTATFTTPIHFDGDLSNCRVDNLDWRPRWFAIKHARQFRMNIIVPPRPVLNINTEEDFRNCWMAVLQYGLLYIDLIKSIASQSKVFPTAHVYQWKR